MTFLLDTNVISEPLRKDPDPGILSGLQRHGNEMAVPTPVWHELHFGCARMERGRKRSAIERYLADVVAATFPFIGYDARAAEWHARERVRLTKAGATPSFVDGQIAAIARVNSLVLVTANRRDFSRFHQIEIQDWRSR